MEFIIMKGLKERLLRNCLIGLMLPSFRLKLFLKINGFSVIFIILHFWNLFKIASNMNHE